MEIENLESVFVQDVAAHLGIPALRLGRNRTAFEGFGEIAAFWHVTLVASKFNSPQLVCGVRSPSQMRGFVSVDAILHSIGWNHRFEDVERAIMVPNLACPQSYLPTGLGPNEYQLCSVSFTNWFCSGRFSILGTDACKSSLIVNRIESLILDLLDSERNRNIDASNPAERE